MCNDICNYALKLDIQLVNIKNTIEIYVSYIEIVTADTRGGATTLSCCLSRNLVAMKN